MSERWTLGIVTVLAIVIASGVCWHWHLDFITSAYGLHGGWGFPIFLGAFAALYVPVALIRRAGRQRQKEKRR